MRNAATVLGTLGGFLALLIGVSVFGYTEVLYRWGEVPDWAELPANTDRIRGAGVIAPILGLVGGAMAKERPRIAGALLLAAAGLLYWAFGFGFAVIFPITMCALAGVLALTAPRDRSPG